MRVERQVLFWLAAALVASLTVLALKDILLPFIAGMVIAYALNPIAEALIRLGLSRILASALLLLVLTLAFVLALTFLLPILVAQFQAMVSSLPTEADRIYALFDTWARERLGQHYADVKLALENGVRQLSKSWAGIASFVALKLWNNGLALVNFLSLVLVTPLVTFYLLVDWERMLATVDGWLPRAHAPTIRRLGGEINDALSAFIRGQGLVCLILAVLYAAGLSIAGLRYGILIGLLTGLLSFIPFVGWALGLLIAMAVAVLEFWPDTLPLLKVLAVFAVCVSLDAGVLAPKIVGSKIGLHPVWLIFALFVFSYLFGFVGTLIAVPVGAAIAVLVRFALDLYLRSSIYSGTAPTTVDADKPTDVERSDQ